MISEILKYKQFNIIVGKYLTVSNICAQAIYIYIYIRNSLLISNLQTLFAVCLRYKRPPSVCWQKATAFFVDIT